MKKSSHEIDDRRTGQAGDPVHPVERDESVETAESAAAEERKALGPRQVIEQAASDIGHGLLDTDLHGIPSNVPGPGPAPEDTPGAEVPPQGGDRRSYAEDQIGHHKTGGK